MSVSSEFHGLIGALSYFVMESEFRIRDPGEFHFSGLLTLWTREDNLFIMSSNPISKLKSMSIEMVRPKMEIIPLIEEYLLFGSVSEREGGQNV